MFDAIRLVMSLLDDFFNNSHDEVDGIMGTSTMVCNGESFSVVFDDYRNESEGGMGGIEPQVTALATAQAADVTNPLAMKNKRCTVAGVAFRVMAVTIGPVAVRFDLISPDENR